MQSAFRKGKSMKNEMFRIKGSWLTTLTMVLGLGSLVWLGAQEACEAQSGSGDFVSVNVNNTQFGSDRPYTCLVDTECHINLVFQNSSPPGPTCINSPGVGVGDYDVWVGFNPDNEYAATEAAFAGISDWYANGGYANGQTDHNVLGLRRCQ